MSLFFLIFASELDCFSALTCGKTLPFAIIYLIINNLTPKQDRLSYMNKLQLYITRSGATIKPLFNLNPNEDVRRNVTDVKNAVNLVKYNPEEKNIFYMLKSTDEGIFFIILRTIPPFAGHHLATWIYIPADTVITAQELDEVVRFTTRKISNTEVTNEDVAELRELYNREYASAPGAPALTAGTGTAYAWRQYGGNTGLTLEDYCGRGIFQQSYLEYKGVILTDAELPYTVDAVNISDQPLGEEAVILPPEKSEEGFTAHIFGRLLDKPILGTLGAELTVTWSRPGFEDVVETEKVTSPEFTPSPVATTDSHKVITPKSFHITSQTTRDPLTSCEIKVNGVDINAQGHSFTSEQLRHAIVTISCEGYLTYNSTMDLAASTRALVQMQERRKIYRFEVPVISSDLGAPIKFEIAAKKPLTGSPLEGYALLDNIQEGPTRMNHLGFVGKSSSMMTKLLYTGMGLFCGIVLMWIFSTCGRHDNAATDQEQTADSTEQFTDEVGTGDVIAAPGAPVADPSSPQTKPATAEAAPALNTNDAEAIRYLENNKVWKRDDMEKYALLRGLYDDLNNYRLSNLKGTWKTKLEKSSQFQKLTGFIENGAKKEKAKKNIASGPFSNDGSITVYRWECMVDP